ncbi:hypothetical protein BN13_140038 [Nostocoides jenkinsii Ben 74]|uniref:Uncharacterized protein n=1 Tax=Nostocoides jenkinsii Ben 74 TaxID=1193518 RepID=A0A077M495_9MICO|nr:hypothetical protein BN13_140038 [Tetrasphaera jenkinsii Ben 74]
MTHWTTRLLRSYEECVSDVPFPLPRTRRPRRELSGGDRLLGLAGAAYGGLAGIHHRRPDGARPRCVLP